MNTPGLMRFLIFLLMIPIHFVSCRWLWSMVRQAAGVTKQEIKMYRKENRNASKPGQRLYFWMLSKSKNKKQFKRLHSAYNACMMPIFFCSQFSILGIFTNSLDKILDTASIIMIMLPIAYGLACIIFYRTITTNND